MSGNLITKFGQDVVKFIDICADKFIQFCSIFITGEVISVKLDELEQSIYLLKG